MTRNPFATVGQMVYGDDHVGRRSEIRTLTERVLAQSTAGATAIIGPPRVGKSSLAYHLFMRPEARAEHPGLLPVWMNVRLVGNIRRLFTRLVEEVWELLQTELDEIDPRLTQAYERAGADEPEWILAQGETQEFLKLVRRRGFRVVLILDEFDAAREVFRSQPGAFQGLREIAYNPEWNIGLVTTSRRELREIVDMADPAESTFPGIFRSVYLRCFDEADLTDLAARLNDKGTEALVPCLQEMSGGHPYLASHLLDRVWTELQGSSFLPQVEEIRALREPVPPEFHDYYRDLKDLLSADGRLKALLEIVLGPQLTVTPDDAESLLQQGLIRRCEDGYRAFSDHFERYLTLLSRELRPWDSWNAVENGVRALIERTFQAKYGNDWPGTYRRARPHAAEILDRCEQMRAREQRTFGARASTQLLDFSYPKDLYELMASHWDLFSPILKKDKAYWRERFAVLTKVRNPMAHSRVNAVGPTDLRLFEAYCAELMDIVGTRYSAGAGRAK